MNIGERVTYLVFNPEFVRGMLCWCMAGLYRRPLIEGRKCDDDFQVRNLLLQGYKALGSLSLWIF